MNGCYADFALGRQCPQLADSERPDTHGSRRPFEFR